MSTGEPAAKLPAAVAGAGKSDYTATIERLAALPAAEYQAARKGEAGRLRIGVWKLDKAVEEARKALEAAKSETKGNGAAGDGGNGEENGDEKYPGDGRQDDTGTWKHYHNTRRDMREQQFLSPTAPYIHKVVIDNDGYAKPEPKWQMKDRRFSEIDFEISPNEINNLPKKLPEIYGPKHGYVKPGMANREYSVYLWQHLSGDPPVITRFTTPGWKNHKGDRVHTSHGRAIDGTGDRPDIWVDLDPKRERNPIVAIQLEPVPHGDERAAVGKAVVGLLRMAELRITAPLMAAVWLALIKPANVTLWCCGTTGKYKTSTCAVFQCFFGKDFDEENLMAQWTADSITSLVDKIYQAANTLLVIDDNPGGGTRFESEDTQKKVSLIVRLVANGVGQGRSNPDGSQRQPKPPFAQVVTTAELEPSAASIVARCFLVHFNDGDVDPDKLFQAQQEAKAGVYAAFTAAAVHWLAPRYDEVRRAHEVRSVELRRECPQIGHKKTPTYIGRMASALHVMLREFCVEAGVLSAEEAYELWYDCWLALQGSASAQREIQEQENPARRFLELTAAGLAQGTAHLKLLATDAAPTQDGSPYGYQTDKERLVARGMCIGWYDGDFLYLNPAPSYEHARARAGGYFPSTERMLAKLLAEGGLLAETDGDGRNSKLVRIGNPGTFRKRVWQISVERVLGEKVAKSTGQNEPPAAAVDAAPAAPEAHNQALDLLKVAVAAMRERTTDAATGDELAEWCSASLRGRPMSAKAVAVALGTLGLSAKQTWRNGRNVRSYYRADLEFILGKLDEQLPLDDDAAADSGVDDPAEWTGDYDHGEGPADD